MFSPVQNERRHALLKSKQTACHAGAVDVPDTTNEFLRAEEPYAHPCDKSVQSTLVCD
jgi:hypothetical protein